MNWKTMNSAPLDGTVIIVRYPLQGNVKRIAHYNTIHKFWQSNGEPFWPVSQQCEWAEIPPEAAPSVANAAPAGEREKFEAWAELTTHEKAGTQHDIAGWYYFDDLTNDRWESWQAAIAALPKPVVAMTDGQIEAIARSHGTGGWQTLPDMIRFGKAILAAAGPDAALVEALLKISDNGQQWPADIARAALAAHAGQGAKT